MPRPKAALGTMHLAPRDQAGGADQPRRAELEPVRAMGIVDGHLDGARRMLDRVTSAGDPVDPR